MQVDAGQRATHPGSLIRGHDESTESWSLHNDLGVVAEEPKVDVIVPGGEIREGSFTLLGPHTQNFLSGLHVDVAVFGDCQALDLSGWGEEVALVVTLRSSRLVGVSSR